MIIIKQLYEGNTLIAHHFVGKESEEKEVRLLTHNHTAKQWQSQELKSRENHVISLICGI